MVRRRTWCVRSGRRAERLCGGWHEVPKARAVQATLTQTVKELRAANVMVEAGTFAPDLVDGVARAPIGKLIEALDGDRETLD